MAKAQRDRLPSGHDKEFVLICRLRPSKEPVLIRCGHRFCEECLDEHFRRCGYNIHLETCPSKVVSCTNENCHRTLKRKYLEDHVIFTCKWTITECRYCKEPLPKCHLKDHVEKCKKFPLTCPDGCGDSIPRELLPNHIEHDCPLKLVSCPYVQMGCNEKVERKNMTWHLEACLEEHLHNTCVTLDETKKRTRTLEEKCTKLTNLEEKVEALQQQLGHMERGIKKRKHKK